MGLIHQSHREFLLELKEKGQPIGLEEVRQILPATSSLVASSDKQSELLAADPEGKPLGTVTQTSPAGDSAIGFSGSTNLLVVWDKDQKVYSVSIRSSGDTIDHVDAILEKPAFFEQFVGKTREELAQSKNLEAVSGATLTSLAIMDAISLRFGGEKKASRFPNPIQLHEITDYFPTASELIPSATHPSLLDVYDATKTKLGLIGRSSPICRSNHWLPRSRRQPFGDGIQRNLESHDHSLKLRKPALCGLPQGRRILRFSVHRQIDSPTSRHELDRRRSRRGFGGHHDQHGDGGRDCQNGGKLGAGKNKSPECGTIFDQLES